MSFKEIKNRDAWAAIRGFVYQVDVTIDRWIGLKENEFLELEKGEDIDIISKDLNDPKIEESRFLEQVKNRESNITLNQKEIIEILLNFFLHKKNNPSQKLYFRFVSNSSYGMERPSIYRDGRGKSAIETWIDLHENEITFFEKIEYISLKKHLIKKINEIQRTIKKDLLSEWQEFKNFISDDNKFIDLIKGFEWSLEFDENINMAKRIKNKLLDFNLISDSTTSNMVYSRLFLFVFKLLTLKGNKRLTKKQLLEEISIPPLPEADRTLFSRLTGILGHLNERVLELEGKVKVNTVDILKIADTVNELVTSDNVFGYELSKLEINPPLPINNGSLRIQKVTNILALFEKKSWINIQGINGVGKTQLANLVATKYKECYWLNLRGRDKHRLYLEYFLSIISNCNIIPDRVKWIKKAVGLIPHNTLIVLNDIPSIDEDEKLKEIFILLTNNLPDDIKVLTVSNFKIPRALIGELFYEYNDLAFTDGEILEYLANKGAGKNSKQFLLLIRSVSERNSTLVNAIMSYLESINWELKSPQLLEGIFSKEYSLEISDRVQYLIKKHLKNEDIKELLYRLSLIHWDFKKKDILAIGNIEERIKHTNEKLYDLVNIWIKEFQKGIYQISPLIYDIGIDNLPENVVINVHLELGKSILSNKTLNQISASRAILSFISGQDYDTGGLILLRVYSSAETKKDALFLKKWGYLDYWMDTPIPSKMKIVIKGQIRSQQIRLKRILEKNTTFLEKEFNTYLTSENVDLSQRLALYTTYLTSSHIESSDGYWYYLGEIKKHWDFLIETSKVAIDNEMILGLLWMPLQLIKDQYDLKKWLNFIEFFENKRSIDFFKNETRLYSLITVLCNQISNDSISIDVDWDEKIRTLFFLKMHFKKKKLEYLEAIVIKEIIALKIQGQGKFLEAEAISNEYLNTFTRVEAKYLICENIGKLYLTENKEKSQKWLLKAIDFNCLTEINFVDTLLFASAAFSTINKEKSLLYCQKAEELTRDKDKYSELDYIQALGELGIAYWLVGDFQNSFKAFENGINKLFSENNESDKLWIKLMLWFGHTIGYIAPDILEGKPPETLKRGDSIVPYTIPYQGIIALSLNDISHRYEAKNTPVLFLHMAFFADGINDIKKAYDFSIRAFDLARKKSDQQMILTVSSISAQYSLVYNKIEEAFEAYLLHSVITSYKKSSEYEELKTIDIPKIFSDKPSNRWNTAEEVAANFVYIPLVIRGMVKCSNKYDEGSRNYIDKILNSIKQYIDESSYKKLWIDIENLITDIFSKKVWVSDLRKKSKAHNKNEVKSLKLLSLVGIIYIAKEPEVILREIINVFPYLMKIHKPFKSILKFIFLPFIKERCIYVLENSFCGNKEVLMREISIIEDIDINDNNAIRLIIQRVVNLLDFNLIEDRRKWLYE